MTPTDEQQAIVEASVETDQSLLVNALAGAAKTTTLELVAKAMPVAPILSLAFNKRIAEEMKRRLPGHVNSATMNSVGHRVWGAAVGRRLVVNTDKTYEILKEIINSLKGRDKSDAYDAFSDLRKGVSKAKMSGYVPDGAVGGAGKSLISREDFFDGLDEPLLPSEQDIVDSAVTQSIQQSYQGRIDFDDQIYMPTLFGGSFPSYPTIMVDEAQDLSPLNHAMLDKLVKRRLIAVGDPWQSIYAFRGAVTASMGRLKNKFSMVEKTLSISFRCPRAVVQRAWFRVPHMRWPDWAEEGIVLQKEDWDAASIPENAAIICRNNAPLFACAMALIQSGRGVHLVGTDLGPSLIRTLKKLGPEGLNREGTLDAIRSWEADRLQRSKSKAAISDKADCLRVFAGFGDTLGAAIAYADHIFQAKGPIQLLSGHKAKGLEWNTVYHLDPWRIPSKFAESEEAKEQELNVRYVIETRAKKELVLVDMERFGAL